MLEYIMKKKRQQSCSDNFFQACYKLNIFTLSSDLTSTRKIEPILNFVFFSFSILVFSIFNLLPSGTFRDHKKNPYSNCRKRESLWKQLNGMEWNGMEFF